MSGKLETASSEVRGDREHDSVLDFLYHDAQRIGSFLAQFDPSGHLQQIRQTEGTVEESNAERKTSFGVDVRVFKAETSAGGGTSENASHGAERVYDPLWSNALEFLGVLQDRGLLKDDLMSAALGQFVMVSGQLSIVDQEFHTSLYSIDEFKKRALRNAAKNINPSTGQLFTQEDIKLDMAVLPRLRAQLQAYLSCEDGETAFCNLKPSGLVTSPSDLLMKYGAVVSGKWTMVGIKDADPEGNAASVMAEMQAAVAAHASNNKFLPEYTTLATTLRLWMGRPVTYHGVTPLAVFREIG